MNEVNQSGVVELTLALQADLFKRLKRIADDYGLTVQQLAAYATADWLTHKENNLYHRTAQNTFASELMQDPLFDERLKQTLIALQDKKSDEGSA